MKKRSLALIALLLAPVMLAGALAACKNPTGGTFTPDANGKYIAKYIRLDALNHPDGIPTGLAIDIAFVAMCEDTSAYLESLGE